MQGPRGIQGARGRRARLLGAALFGSLLANGSFVASVAAEGEIATSVDVSIEATPYAYVPVTFHITFDAAAWSGPGPCGTLTLYDDTSGSPVAVTTMTQDCYTHHVYTHDNNAGYGLGTRSFFATFVPNDPLVYAGSTSATVDYAVGKSDSSVSVLASAATVEAHHPIRLEAGVGAWTNAFYQGATMTFRRSGATTPLCSNVPVDAGNYTICTTSTIPVGTYTITAQYSGNTWVNGSTSDPFILTVTPDTVHASGVTTQYTTFYPVTDSYRDTVAIKGTRAEPIDVTIRIYTPGGTLIKTTTIARGTGAYSYAWNGRNSDGIIRAEGKYKVTQTLRDVAGTIKTYTHYVTLSKKKLYTYTKSITKLGSSLTAKGTSGTGTVTVNTTTGYALLKSGSNGWAGAGWQFTLPSATVYKSMKFRVYAKRSPGVPPTDIGMQNFSWCAYASGTAWDEGCFDRRLAIGNGSNTLQWYSTTGSVTTNRSGTIARGMVSDPTGACYVYKAQIVLTYGVLKY